MGSKAPSRVRIPQSPPVTSERLTDVQRRFIIPLLRNAPVAQLDRAPGYELGGRRFESFRARQNNRPLAGFFVPGGFAGPPRTAGVRARAKRCFASGSRSPFRARQNNRPLAGFFVPGGLVGPPRAAGVRACAKRCFASGRCASRRAESIDRCRHGGSAATRASARRVGQSSRAYQAGRSHGRGSWAKRQSPRERCNRRFPCGPTGCAPVHRTGRPCGRDGQAAPGNGPVSWSAHSAGRSSR